MACIKPLISDKIGKVTGPMVLISAFVRPLTPGGRQRLWWGVIRASITCVLLTALPSLLGLVSVFDCTRTATVDQGTVWLNDASRDKECYNNDEYWTYAGMHLSVLLLWVFIIGWFINKAHNEADVDDGDVVRLHAQSCKV